MNLQDKLQDIVKHSTCAFTDNNLDDAANNARKAGEAVCKAIILKKYGDKLGSDLIEGKALNYKGDPIMYPALSYFDLIEAVT
ncbi:MAG: hypothetical protein AAF992_15950, partial [Bacteroidota bacterium]